MTDATKPAPKNPAAKKPVSKTAGKPAAKRAPRDSQLDLDAIQSAWSAGKKTAKQIGREHGISDEHVLRLAKKHGWTRVSPDQVRARAQAKIARERRKQRAQAQKDAGALTVIEPIAEEAAPDSPSAILVDELASRQAEVEKRHVDYLNRHHQQADAIEERITKLLALDRSLPEMIEAILTVMATAEDAIRKGDFEPDKDFADTNLVIRDNLTRIAHALEINGVTKTFRLLAMTRLGIIAAERKLYQMDDSGKDDDPAAYLDALAKAAQSYVPPQAPKMPGASMDIEG